MRPSPIAVLSRTRARHAGCSAASGGQGVYQVPSAVAIPPEEAPRTPYADPRGMLVQTWKPGHWASWTFEATSQERGFNGTNATNYRLRGGFQGSRGDTQGEATYIENVYEELDAPGEFFFNESTRTLFLWHNESSGVAPPSDGSLAVTVNKWLINVSGSMAAPVRDVSVVGLGLRDTASTNMDNHSMPSSGDWALPRSAVLFLEGTERALVAGCVFERTDGTSIMLSAYNRNATIRANEFAWIGASAVVAWGNTEGGDPRVPAGMGYDGSAGDQPRYSMIEANIMRELGVWVKQSSAFTTFQSSENTFKDNVVYNGPRAHVNINEGKERRRGLCSCVRLELALARACARTPFPSPSRTYSRSLRPSVSFPPQSGFRGGNLIVGNVLVNSCRESGDHGPVLYPCRLLEIEK